MSSALLLKLVQPKMEMSEKFDLVWKYFSKIAGTQIFFFSPYSPNSLYKFKKGLYCGKKLNNINQ
jgi:hypothetical protein